MNVTKTDDRGFTMIEIIVVLLVMVIIGTVIVMSDVYSTTGYDLSSEVEIIKTHLRYTQARAMNSNSIWGMNFYRSDGVSFYHLFQIITDPVSGQIEKNRIVPGENPGDDPENPPPVSLPKGMVVSSGKVYFDDWGRPYTAAPPSVESTTITVTVDTEAITIEKNTGFIP